MEHDEKIQYLKESDKRLAKVIDRIGELNYSSYNFSHGDNFLFLTKEIVGQMISSSVKRILLQRLYTICNNQVTPEIISRLSIEDLRSIGLSRAKSSYILNLADVFINKEIDFDKLLSAADDVVINTLSSIRGIGIWTSKMYLIFYLQREDVLPYEDGAFLQSYKWLYNTKNVKPDSIARRCKKWKPFTSIGARYLYRALDLGLTKTPIKEFLSE